MRVLLVSANTERVTMPAMPLGAALVAAAARRAGHEVLFLDLLRESGPVEALRRGLVGFAPDVIGISIRNIDDQSRESPHFFLEQVRPLVAVCRASSTAPIVLGGAGYSIFPKAILAFLGADYGVAGDGEVAFPLLLQRLEEGSDPGSVAGVRVSGRSTARAPDFSVDLGGLPETDDELWSGYDSGAPDTWVPVQGRRGCANDCSYCSTLHIQGRAIRIRPPGLVVESIRTAVQAGFLSFYIVDSAFNIPEAYALEICERLAVLDPRVNWRCILYPHRVSERLVRAMAAAGCSEVSLGFESGCRSILHSMNKRFSPEDVRATSDVLRSHGIRRIGFLLLGGPGETRETVEESLSFADSLQLETLRVTVGIRIYPGTPLARRAVEEGVIDANDDLLSPRFYLAPGLETWIYERITPGVNARQIAAPASHRGEAPSTPQRRP